MATLEPFGPLVSPAWLLQHARDPTVRVIDLRWYLTGKRGAEAFALGHIPGAVFVDLDVEITARKGPGRHPLPGGGQLERAMRKAGVHTTTRVVVYDDAGGSIAARLWWLLRYFGHEAVAVLDGGIDAYARNGGALDTGTVSVSEGDFTAGPPRSEWVVSKSGVNDARTDGDAVLLDARAPERYRGDVEPVDARPGHIPGARSAPWSENLSGGHFVDPEALRARYASLGVTPGREVIVYCGSGVTACHDLLALERAGFTGSKLYEGSWSDWARDAALPAGMGDDDAEP